jgi:tetratricopeptide (TPR) repeat protein
VKRTRSSRSALFLALILILVSAGPRPAVAADNTLEALVLVAQGQLRLESGEIAEGLKLMRRALALDPNNPELVEEFGLALAEAGIGDEATKQLSATSALGPTGEATLGMLLAQGAQNPKELAAAIPHLEKGAEAIPLGPQARLILAQSLVRLDRGEQAMVQVQLLLSDRPEDPRLLLLAGQALRLQGKNVEAIEQFKRAQAVPEASQRATIELVETLAATGKYREASDLLGAFIKKEGGSPQSLTRWATLLARAQDRSKAREVLDDVLSRDPNLREALYLKAMIEAVDGHIESAEQLYRRLLAADPHDPDATLGLVRLLRETRRLAEARGQLDGLWKTIEEAKLADGPAGVELAAERATIELLDRRTADALPWLQRLGAGPLDRRPLALWAEYFRLRNAFSEGLTWITGAKVTAEPELALLKTSIEAEFRFATGDEVGANQLLAPLLGGDAEKVSAALGVLQRRKRYADVVARGGEAIARLGDQPELRFSVAAALERTGRWDDAVKEFRTLLAKESENAAALNYLGYMFADHGVNLDEAGGMLTKAVSLEPTSGAYLDPLGWLYFRKGDLDRAEKHLMEAARLEPFDATVNEHLGDLHKARGNNQQAAEAYRQALTFEMEEAGQKERIEKKLAEVTGAPKE